VCFAHDVSADAEMMLPQKWQCRAGESVPQCPQAHHFAAAQQNIICPKDNIMFEDQTHN